MANTRSDLMANMLANPAVQNDPRVTRGTLRYSAVMTVFAGTESANHYFPQRRFNILDRITHVEVVHSDLGTTIAMDLGLYESGDWTREDQAEKDVDIWVDGRDFSSVRDLKATILGSGSGSVGAATQGRAVWQDAGDSEIPGDRGTYDAAWKIIGAPTAVAGTITTFFTYVSGG